VKICRRGRIAPRGGVHGRSEAALCARGFALSVLFLVSVGSARAATFTVNTIADTGAGSLRAAITSANLTPTVASNINFSVSGTITLGSTLPAIANTSPGSLTIDGSGQAITVDGANSFQIFSVNSGATLDLKFLTLAHGTVTVSSGFGQGGAIVNIGTLNVTNCTFLDNRAIGGIAIVAPGRGGAILNVGTLTVSNCTFVANQAIGSIESLGEGGAITNDGASLTISDSTFTDNHATDGGAIFNVTVATITNSTFSANQAAGIGGAVVNYGSLHVREWEWTPGGALSLRCAHG